MASKVEDCNWSINDMFHELICYCGGRDFQDDATKGLKASILAKAHAEGVAGGAERERERIRELAMPVDNFLHQMSLIIPISVFNDASVLAPSEQEKITRLAEIVADMSATEPPVEIITRAGSVLAPTKESKK